MLGLDDQAVVGAEFCCFGRCWVSKSSSFSLFIRSLRASSLWVLYFIALGERGFFGGWT